MGQFPQDRENGQNMAFFFIIFDHFPRPGEIDICKIFMIRVAHSLSLPMVWTIPYIEKITLLHKKSSRIYSNVPLG